MKQVLGEWEEPACAVSAPPSRLWRPEESLLFALQRISRPFDGGASAVVV